MKIRFLPAVFILIADVVSAKSLVPSDADHLIPVEPERSPRYRKILLSKLGVTPFNCGRTILFPPFEPENALSVYWVLRNGQRTYHATYISAEKNLWQQIDGDRYPARAKAVRIHRWDADIPERTALLVREVWLHMLQGSQGPRHIRPPPGVVTLDTTSAELSLEVPHGPPLRGELAFSLSYPGKKTKQLGDLSNSLYEYCKAAPAKRAGIANKIDQQAQRLIAELQPKK